MNKACLLRFHDAVAWKYKPDNFSCKGPYKDSSLRYRLRVYRENDRESTLRARVDKEDSSLYQKKAISAPYIKQENIFRMQPLSQQYDKHNF